MYLFKTIRNIDGSTVEKLQRQGWELVSSSPFAIDFQRKETAKEAAARAKKWAERYVTKEQHEAFRNR